MRLHQASWPPEPWSWRSPLGGGGDDGGGGDTGRELFAGALRWCHTLKVAGTSGRIGPSFVELQVTKAIVLRR